MHFTTLNIDVLPLLSCWSSVSASASESFCNTASGSEAVVYSETIMTEKDPIGTIWRYIENIPLTNWLMTDVTIRSSTARLSTTLKWIRTSRSLRWTKSITWPLRLKGLFNVELRHMSWMAGCSGAI